MKSTMLLHGSGLAEQLVAGDGEGDIMGGKQSGICSFSDVLSFTITEELGAQGTVNLK